MSDERQLQRAACTAPARSPAHQQREHHQQPPQQQLTNSSGTGSAPSSGAASRCFLLFLIRSLTPMAASPSGTVLPPVVSGAAARLLAVVPAVYLLQARGRSASALPNLYANCRVV